MTADEIGSPPLSAALQVAAAAWQRFVSGSTLERALTAERVRGATTGDAHPRLLAAAQDIVFTTTRSRALIDALLRRLATRTPDPPVAALLAVALGQVLDERHAQYTVVDQAVGAAKANPATAAASGFVNAVLRNAIRQREHLIEEAQRDDAVRFNLPRWWLRRLRSTYPQQWRAIATASTAAAPLILRVNPRRTSVAAYLQRLAAAGASDAWQVGPTAVALASSRPVREIPGFDDGAVSVQDAGAQLAGLWLDLRDSLTVLDACAAPGGKTVQMTEVAARLTLDALDVDATRLHRIEENLARTDARSFADIRLLVGDARDAARITGRDKYARVLLDAPCTASGIVGRHPDIPWLRQPADVAQLATMQAQLLDALWPLVERTGRLLYVVCSVFPEEGQQQVEQFAARHADARAVPLWQGGPATLQLLPTRDRIPWTDGLPTAHDGFFYALFERD